MKFRKLQRKLSCSRIVAVGTLELLWIAVQKNAPQGDIGRFTDEEIAIECDWEGDPELLVDSLVECNWLDRCDTHRLIVHDWKDHAPGWVKRQLARHKKSLIEGASQSIGETPSSPVTVSSVQTVTDDHLDTTPNQRKPNPTQPKETEGKEREPEAAPPPADAFVLDWVSVGPPSRLDTGEIRELFRQWRATRQQEGRKLGMDVMEMRGLVDSMYRTTLSAADAVECLRACANNGWKTFNVNAWRRQNSDPPSGPSSHSVGQQSLALGKL